MYIQKAGQKLRTDHYGGEYWVYIWKRHYRILTKNIVVLNLILKEN